EHAPAVEEGSPDAARWDPEDGRVVTDHEITLTLHSEDGTWWADSGDGYYAGADTLPGLLRLVAVGLPFHLGCEASPASSLLVHDGSSRTVGSPGRFRLVP
ncbi:MAG: hypothetical protein ACRDQD_27270, partial [Nocardioidaceae bacterium]